ncbi:hypothetical protein JCM8547_002768 [Rhodosporidiobolus lusitaniae]
MRFSFAALALSVLAVTSLAAPSGERRVVDLPGLRQRGLDVDLGSQGLKRGLDVDLGSQGLKRALGSQGLRRGLDVDLGSQGLRERDGPVTDVVNSLTAGLNSLLNPVGLGAVSSALSDSDISISAADPDTGLAVVHLSGAGILSGVEVDVPVAPTTGEISGTPTYYKAE